ncbi:MAG: hypothetical protein F6J94_15555 [Moorea sp. SIO1F2]|uniref:hypothetical protein n=1 Tax=Moorena sp. SIO1F2 TaxID=2607819 RepID=UPI0013B6A066|nr:hypothetical protein [Moorena sp. SIO1F2]NET83278.1 hypothetical protein [Moorena sp. SIO1F2]
MRLLRQPLSDQLSANALRPRYANSTNNLSRVGKIILSTILISTQLFLPTLQASLCD